MTTLDPNEKPVADPLDDSAILRVIAVWAPSVEAAMSARAGHNLCQLTPDAKIALNVGRGEKRQHHVIDVGSGAGWGLIQLGPSVWEITPPVWIKGQIHAFVTLVAVPEPAPWVRGVPQNVAPPAPKKKSWIAKCRTCGESVTMTENVPRERKCIQCNIWVEYEEA